MLPLTGSIGKEKTSGSEMLYEPSSVEVFDAIVPEYLGGILYGALCESRCAEQAARRTAMDSATQNAEEMIADLSLKFNQARQAGFAVRHLEDLTDQWKEYYLEALWTQDNVCLPRGKKYTYVLFVCERM